MCTATTVHSLEKYPHGSYKYNSFHEMLFRDTTPPLRGVPGGSDGKEAACSAGDPGSIPELGRFLAEENGSLLQYSCLETSMDRGAWQVTVPGVANSQTQCSD